MSKLGSLLKVNLISSIGINKITKEKSKVEKNKAIFLAATIGFSAIMIFFVAILYFDLLAQGYKQLGMIDFLLVTGFILSSIIIFFTSIYKAQGTLFSFKDHDLLMSLPIKESDILISKMIQLLITNYFALLFILIPSSIIYFKYSNVSYLFFINLIFVYLALPLIPIVLSSIIAFGISYVSSRFKHKNLVTTLGTLIVVLLIFVASSKVNDIINYFVANSESITEGVLKIYPPAILAVKGLATNSIIYTLLFVLLSSVIFALFILIFNKSYKSITSKLQESYKKANYKIKEMKSSTQLMALLKKEIKRYFASPIYVINTIIGPILLFTIAIATIFLKENVIISILEIEIIKDIIPIFVIFILCGILTLSCTTNSSISLEGKNLWILKSSPIRPIDILKAKILLNVVLVLPILIISDIIMVISLEMTFIQGVYLVLITGIFSIIVAITGIIVNLYFPKFNWISETAVVKQGASVIISMLIGMIFIGIPIGIFILFKIQNTILFLVGMLVYKTIILLISILILNNTSVRLFKKL